MLPIFFVFFSFLSKYQNSKQCHFEYDHILTVPKLQNKHWSANSAEKSKNSFTKVIHIVYGLQLFLNLMNNLQTKSHVRPRWNKPLDLMIKRFFISSSLNPRNLRKLFQQRNFNFPVRRRKNLTFSLFFCPISATRYQIEMFSFIIS